MKLNFKPFKQIIIFLTISLMLCLCACDSNSNVPEISRKKETDKLSTQKKQPHASPEHLFGIVKETINSASYTYILLEHKGKNTWVAIPETSVDEGEEIMLQPGMPMHNFTSKTLNRTFETIIFSSGIVSPANHRSAMMDSPSRSTAALSPATSVSPHKGRPVQPITKGIKIDDFPEDAITVSDIYSKSEELAGRKVKIKAMVVKTSPNIMGKNWIHIQDGTGGEEKGDYDITVTSMDLPSPGEIVIISGILNTDKDFGAGYVYDILIEEASVEKTGDVKDIKDAPKSAQ